MNIDGWYALGLSHRQYSVNVSAAGIMQTNQIKWAVLMQGANDLARVIRLAVPAWNSVPRKYRAGGMPVYPRLE